MRVSPFLGMLLIWAAALSACGSDARSTPSPDDPVRLGALVPLSPPGAVGAGQAMRDAMDIAVAELNDDGGILGRPVELIATDSEGTPERGIAAVEALINEHNVAAVAGGFHSSVAMAVKEVAHDAGVPIVFTDAWADAITSDMQLEVFRIGPLNSEVAAIDVAFIASLPDFEKVVIITEDTDYGIPVAQNTSEGLALHSIEAITHSVDIGAENFTEAVELIRAEDPDLVVIYPTGEAGYRVQQQAASAGVGPEELPFLCNQESMESEAFWATVPDGNYCFVRRVGLPEQSYNDVARDFAGRYKAATGKGAVESYALAAYDSILVLAQAITTAGTSQPRAIIDALEAITYEGALGTISFPYNSSNPPGRDGVEDKWWHQFADPAVSIIQYREPGQSATEALVVFPETYKTADPVLPGR